MACQLIFSRRVCLLQGNLVPTKADTFLQQLSKKYIIEYYSYLERNNKLVFQE